MHLPSMDGLARVAICQTWSAVWSGFPDPGPHLACPGVKPHSPAFHLRPEDQKEWCRCERGVLLATRVVLLGGALFRSLRRCRCGASFAGSGEGGGPRVGSRSEVPGRCATRRSVGPCPNAKPRWKAELQRGGWPNVGPIPW